MQSREPARASLTGARRLAAAAALAATLTLTLVEAAAAQQQPPQPRNTSKPAIAGGEPRQDGQTVTANPGTWSTYPGTSVSIRYQWYACTTSCEAIAGATANSYAIGSGDVGRRLMLRVYANCNLPSPTCTETHEDSARTGTVLPDPHNEGAPQVTGLARQGELLAASAGFWRTVSPLSFHYQWLRCDGAGGNCTDVPGATSPEYRLGAADVGATMRIAVTARNARPRQATALSPETAAVTKATAAGRGLRMLSPFPTLTIAGVVAGPSVRLTEFTVRGPRGALVTVRCRGRGCPFRRRRQRLRSQRLRFRSLQRRLRAGILLEVTVTRRGFIGKYSRVRMRSGRVPARVDRCLRPGARRPSRCPNPET